MLRPGGIERDLMLALFALRDGLIAPEQLRRRGAESWGRDGGPSLADLLVERGELSTEARAGLESRVDAATWPGATEPGSPPPDDPGRSTPPATFATADGPSTAAWVGPVGDDGEPTVGEDDNLAAPPPPCRRFRLIRLHAVGGMGRIWLARDEHIGRDVVLKELTADLRGRGQYAGWFLAEARITAQLQHPGIVPVYDLAGGDTARGRPFYAMQYAGERTLSRAIRDDRRDRGGRRGPSPGLLDAFVAICNTLAYAHARGVIHRDLKPSNVALGDFGEVFVLDWGLALPLGVAGASSKLPPVSVPDGSLRGHGADLLGTPAYIPPEQAGGASGVGMRADVYGLGAILYEILTGKPPRSGGDARALLEQARHDRPRPPRAVDPGVPPALEAVCLKALAFDPADRYESAAALGADVRRWLADEPVSAYRDPIVARLGRAARRHRTIAVGAAAFLLTAVVGLGIGNWRLAAEKAAAEQARDDARAQFRLARDAVDRMLRGVADERLPHQPGLTGVRLELIDEAAQFYRRFVRSRPERDVRLAAARVELSAANLRRLTGDRTRAVAGYGAALTLLRGLMAEVPDETSHAEAYCEACKDLGSALAMDGRLDEAVSSQREAVRVAERLRRRFAALPRFALIEGRMRNNLAATLRKVDRTGDAEHEADAAVELIRAGLPPRAGLRERLSLAMALDNRGEFRGALGRVDEARLDLDDAVNRLRGLLGDHPGNNDVEYVLAEALVDRGRLPGDPAAARRDLDEAVGLLGRLPTDFVEVAHYPADLALARAARAVIRSAAGDEEGADADLADARPVLAELADRPVGSPSPFRRFANELDRLADLADGRGQVDRARALRAEAEGYRRRAAGAAAPPAR